MSSAFLILIGSDPDDLLGQLPSPTPGGVVPQVIAASPGRNLASYILQSRVLPDGTQESFGGFVQCGAADAVAEAYVLGFDGLGSLMQWVGAQPDPQQIAARTAVVLAYPDKNLPTQPAQASTILVVVGYEPANRLLPAGGSLVAAQTAGATSGLGILVQCPTCSMSNGFISAAQSVVRPDGSPTGMYLIPPIPRSPVETYVLQFDDQRVATDFVAQSIPPAAASQRRVLLIGN